MVVVVVVDVVVVVVVGATVVVVVVVNNVTIGTVGAVGTKISFSTPTKYSRGLYNNRLNPGNLRSYSLTTSVFL